MSYQFSIADGIISLKHLSITSMASIAFFKMPECHTRSGLARFTNIASYLLDFISSISLSLILKADISGLSA